jgi:hypothetical protein
MLIASSLLIAVANRRPSKELEAESKLDDRERVQRIDQTKDKETEVEEPSSTDTLPLNAISLSVDEDAMVDL